MGTRIGRGFRMTMAKPTTLTACADRWYDIASGAALTMDELLEMGRWLICARTVTDRFFDWHPMPVRLWLTVPR